MLLSHDFPLGLGNLKSNQAFTKLSLTTFVELLNEERGSLVTFHFEKSPLVASSHRNLSSLLQNTSRHLSASCLRDTR